jgi:hypothetical protein
VNRSAHARFALLALITLFAPLAHAQLLSPAWVELGVNGAAIARVIVATPADCPSLRIDGIAQPMKLREPTPQGFRPVCELAIPAGAKSASLNGRRLHLPRPDPKRIVALGDTGCRIKGAAVQDCNHPDKWPFLQLATQAAREKSQFVIHVGDYLYRENPCPAGANLMCGGTPAGDNWDAWNADFFTPAAKLLTAAPWAFSRGNHEDCLRSWRGFFYYLDPRPWTGTCAKYSAPYVIKLGSFELAMIDSSAVKEDEMDEDQIAEYMSQLSSLRVENAWLADHHPFWGLKTDDSGKPTPLSVPLQAAWSRTQPRGFQLVLSGHVHLFEFDDFGQNYPPQLVVGDSGTDLAVPIGNPMERVQMGVDSFAMAESRQQFGYVVLSERGRSWRLALKNLSGHSVEACRVSLHTNDACKSFSGPK